MNRFLYDFSFLNTHLQKQPCFRNFINKRDFSQTKSRIQQQPANSYTDDSDEPLKTVSESVTTPKPVVDTQVGSLDLDIDLSLEQPIKSALPRSVDKSFKFGELIVCRMYTKGGKLSEMHHCRLINLKPHGIYNYKLNHMWHEHIVHKSSLAQSNNLNSQTQQSAVIFNFGPEKFEFRRATLNEYLNLTAHQAVPSQYSILTLVPWLLEIKNGSKM
jgi:hypothetical protein